MALPRLESIPGGGLGFMRYQLVMVKGPGVR